MTPSHLAEAVPLVSCIMPTFNRREFIPRGLRCFLNQDYPNTELIVVDDGTDPVGDLMPPDPRVVYIRLAKRQTIGAKRDLACSASRGHFIAHCDDDDWYTPSRITIQVNALQQSNADICGSSIVYLVDWERRDAFQMDCDLFKAREYALNIPGATFLYRRDGWVENRFADRQSGEDTEFLGSFAYHRILDLRDPLLCIVSRHPANTTRVGTRLGKGSNCSPTSLKRIETVLRNNAPRLGTPPSRWRRYVHLRPSACIGGEQVTLLAQGRSGSDATRAAAGTAAPELSLADSSDRGSCLKRWRFWRL